MELAIFRNEEGRARARGGRTAFFARPDAFTGARGAWGGQRCTMVRLAAVGEKTLGEAMTLAWQNTLKQSKSYKRWT